MKRPRPFNRRRKNLKFIGDKIDDALYGEKLSDCYAICLLAASVAAKHLDLSIEYIVTDLREFGVKSESAETIQ
jgi:hypothetical protein